MDASKVEVLLARKLADNEPLIRQKALDDVQTWIQSKSKRPGFTHNDLVKLWKGLYYAMWMRDKPLLQEELADQITDFSDLFADDDQRLLYYQVFFETIAREWKLMDSWRTDKFLMLFRRIVRSGLTWLKSSNWSEESVKKLFELYGKSVFQASNDAYLDELKCHFASLYLDELDSIGGTVLSSEQVLQFLDVYIKMLNAKTSEAFHISIMKEIFETLLLYFSNSLCQNGSDEHTAPAEDALKIDYSKILSRLTDEAEKARPERKKSFDLLLAKFGLVVSGKNPFGPDEICFPDLVDRQPKQSEYGRKDKLQTTKSLKRKGFGEDDKRSKLSKHVGKPKPEDKAPKRGSAPHKKQKMKKGRKALTKPNRATGKETPSNSAAKSNRKVYSKKNAKSRNQ